MPPEPPDGLDAVGEHLWRKVTGTYVFDDPGSYVVLEEACRARQRAARCAKLIDRDGELFEGNKAHPLLRDELQNRALACRLLSRLGLDLEPIKPIGPPAGRLCLMPTVRHRRRPMKVATLVPEWVKDLVEHGIEPPLNTQAECDYVAWSFWDAAVPGLPPADSPEDREILRRAWERQERARQDAAARKGP